MKVSAIAKPIQKKAKPMFKPKKVLLSAVAATALALTPMTTINAQEAEKEKVEIPAAKKTENMMKAANWMFGAISALLLGMTIYNYRFSKNQAKQDQTKENNIDSTKNI